MKRLLAVLVAVVGIGGCTRPEKATNGAIAPPALWEWLMGLSIGHTELGDAEMELFRKLAKDSDK